jgi:hypothetical protein
VTEIQTWRDVNAAARFVSRREQIIALVCDVCDRDIVYVRIRDLQQLAWASKWFGCDCAQRRRLTLEGTRFVVEGILGSRRSGLATCRTVEDVRIEAWAA